MLTLHTNGPVKRFKSFDWYIYTLFDRGLNTFFLKKILTIPVHGSLTLELDPAGAGAPKIAGDDIQDGSVFTAIWAGAALSGVGLPEQGRPRCCMQGLEMSGRFSTSRDVLGVAVAVAAAIACGVLSGQHAGRRRTQAAILIQATVRGRLYRRQAKQAQKRPPVCPARKALHERNQPRMHRQIKDQEQQAPETPASLADTQGCAVPTDQLRGMSQSGLAQRGRGLVETVGGTLGAWHQMYESVQTRGSIPLSVVRVDPTPQPSASTPPSVERKDCERSSDSNGSAASVFKAYQHQARRRTKVGTQHPQHQHLPRPQHPQRQKFSKSATEPISAPLDSVDVDSDAQIDMEKLVEQLNKNRNLLRPRDINSNGTARTQG